MCTSQHCAGAIIVRLICCCLDLHFLFPSYLKSKKNYSGLDSQYILCKLCNVLDIENVFFDELGTCMASLVSPEQVVLSIP